MKTMEPKSADTKKKKVAMGAAGASIIFHVTLFLLIGSVVVVEYAVPRATMTGEVSPVVSEEAAPSDTPEPVGEPEAPETPSEAAAAPAPAAPELTVSSINVLTVSSPVSSFQMPVTLGGSGGTGSGTAGTGSSGTGGTTGKPGKISNPFGGGERVGKSSMEGILYDLKQTKDKKPTGMDPTKYLAVLTDFFKRNWDRKIFDNFYQVKDPLYTTQIFMPLMSAGEAPKAFKVEKEVQPAEWVVFYQGEFQAPTSGQYRFAGYADDVLVVRVNGKVVLDGSIMTQRANNKPMSDAMVRVNGQEFVAAHKIGNGNLAYSDWMNLDADAVNKLEILVGERPGGQFCAFLLVEEKGRKYNKDANGRPILPIFKTADLETTSTGGTAIDPAGPIFGVK